MPQPASAPALKDAASLSVAAAAASPLSDVSSHKPWFSVPTFPEIDGADAPFVYHGFTENVINAVLFEIPENGADVCHLAALHAEFIIPALYPFLSHKWAASWLEGSKATPHLADIEVKEQICALNFALPGEVRVRITQVGPSQVYLQMQIPGFGRIVIVETVTPAAPMTLRVLHALYAEPTIPRVVAKVVLFATLAQFNKDVPIWCNKVYEPRPVLVKEDASIGRYRSWIKQFTKEGAITFEEAMRQHVADSLGFPDDHALAW